MQGRHRLAWGGAEFWRCYCVIGLLARGLSMSRRVAESIIVTPGGSIAVAAHHHAIKIECGGAARRRGRNEIPRAARGGSDRRQHLPHRPVAGSSSTGGFLGRRHCVYLQRLYRAARAAVNRGVAAPSSCRRRRAAASPRMRAR